MAKFNNVETSRGGFQYRTENGMLTACSWDLFLIHWAWDHGCGFEDLADGFGKGGGTNGDWSGIRDSSGEAVLAMLERALNHLFK